MIQMPIECRTYSDKKVNHEKYVECQVNLLRCVFAPFFAFLDSGPTKQGKTATILLGVTLRTRTGALRICKKNSWRLDLRGRVHEIYHQRRDAQFEDEHHLKCEYNE